MTNSKTPRFSAGQRVYVVGRFHGTVLDTYMALGGFRCYRVVEDGMPKRYATKRVRETEMEAATAPENWGR